MLRLRVRAPYGAFRPFTAGWYRPTAPFPTPSALYGLLLNVANIDYRRDDGISPATLTDNDPPTVEIAIGLVALPRVQRLYHQLHNYPVGESAGALKEESRGNKYNIQPVRRELLSGIDVCIALRGNEALEARVRDGLQLGSRYAPEGRPRYGLPFLGDNSFMLSTLREEATLARWLAPAVLGDESPRGATARLTVWIDRADMSRTRGELYGPLEEASVEVPAEAWTVVPARREV
jgi:CRISPR-associated protein Cas5t